MLRENTDLQYRFLEILCGLYDGTDYVAEDKIREAWPGCPPHHEILELGVGEYFERHPDFQIHAYKPTGKGRAALRKWNSSDQTAKELQKLRQDFDKYCTDEAAYKTSQEHFLKKESRKNIIVSAVSALLTAAAANLLVYYWPDIIRGILWLCHLFHRLLPS